MPISVSCFARSSVLAALSLSLLAARPALAVPHGGGPDVLVGVSRALGQPNDVDLAFTSGAYAFACAQLDDPLAGGKVVVYLSRDRGATWSPWTLLGDSDFDLTTGYYEPSLYVAEGTTPRLFVAFRHTFIVGASTFSNIEVMRADLGATGPGSTSTSTAMSSSGVSFRRPDVAADDRTTPAYTVHVIAEAADGTGTDIWVARSTNQGVAWAAEYAIASITSAFGGNDRYPRIACGSAGYVHATWSFAPNPIVGGSRTVVYRRANGGAAAIGNWFAPVTIATDFYVSDITAAPTGGKVTISATPIGAATNPWFFTYQADGAAVFGSGTSALLYGPAGVADFDGAGAFVAGVRLADGRVRLGQSMADTLSDAAVAVVTDDRTVVAALTSPYADAGSVWIAPGSGAGDTLRFDASYFLRPAFPRHFRTKVLADPPVTPPTLAQLDADPELEIVYGDATGKVHVLEAAGAEKAGWPYFAGSLATDATIAVGDVDGDHENEVVVGNLAGQVIALNADGSLRAGFPKFVNTGKSVHVSLGDLVGDARAEIVACAGNQVHVYDGGANEASGFPVFTTVSVDIKCPASIGDLDGDGHRELVVLTDGSIRWYSNDGTLGVLRSIAGTVFEEPASLADVDGDGDLEIATATTAGRVDLVDHATLADRTGWPYLATNPVYGVAFGKVSDPEPLGLAFLAGGNVHRMRPDGTHVGAVYNVGALAHGAAPVIAELDGFGGARELAFGSPDAQYRVTDDGPSYAAFWPMPAGDVVDDMAAMGDLTASGNTHLVFLNHAGLDVFELNQPLTTADLQTSWPQYGYDAGHASCYRCGGSATVGVPDEGAASAALALAATPNPSRGAATLSFSLERGGEATLAIHDVGGRVVRRIASGPLAAGAHRVTWDGRDEQGRDAAPGLYFARLALSGERAVAARIVRVR